MNFVYQILNWIDNFVSGLDRTQWVMIMVGVLACGIFLLRGFGSRKTY
jgi:hypothetical protein